MRKIYIYLITFLLLAVFVVLAVTSIWPDRKSPTCDELAHHIPVGYVLLTKWDLKMDTSHPPLSRYIVALPLKLFMDLNMPEDISEWRKEDRSEFGKALFYKYNSQPHKMIFLSRLAVVIVGLLCGIILFLWADALFGTKAALFSLFLYSLSPNMLAHTRLATTDMVTTCFMLLSVCTFWLFVKAPSIKNVLTAGVCLGLAQLSKYSSLLLYPLFCFLLLFELPSVPDIAKRKRFIVKFLIVIAISVLVLWAGYGFELQPVLKDAMRAGEKIRIAHSFARNVFPFWDGTADGRLDEFLLKAPFPLGEHLLGILGVLRHAYVGHGTFFCGRWSGHGNPLYFILAVMIKTPLPALFFLITGLLVSLKNGIKRNERFIIATIALFFITASFSSLQLGLRYILCLYPFFFILAGRSIEFMRRNTFRILAVILMAWYAFSALWTWPDYLSYFNETIGGPRNGYRYLRDSNIDWGQDLPALARYMRENDVDEIGLFYFGTADPAYYGIRHRPLSPAEINRPGKGVYAVSVHKIESVKWAPDNEPDAVAGGSIFVYDFRE